MSGSRIYLLFLSVTVSLGYSESLNGTVDYRKFHSCSEMCQAPLSRLESANLRTTLSFIQESAEFRPLRLSLILPEYQSNVVDFLFKYLGENAVEVHLVKSTDLPPSSSWEDRSNRTWTLFVRDIYTLNIVIHWQQEMWKACNQYLIVYMGRGVTVSWRAIFKNLWRKYRVYRAVVVSADDDYGCLMKFRPFDVRDDDYGSVQKLCLASSPERRSEHTRLQSLSISGRERFTGINNVDEIVTNEGARLFENFRDLNSYPVNVFVFHSLFMNISYDERNKLKLAKVDSNMVFALEKAMNATFAIQARRRSDLWREDPFTTSLRNIVSGKVEMVITGFFIKPYTMFSNFRFTCSVYEDKVCFLSPDSGLVPKMYMPFMPFKKDMWLLLVAYNLVITLIWCFVQYTNELLRPDRSPNRSTQRTRPGNIQGDVGSPFSVFLEDRSEPSTVHPSLVDRFHDNWLASSFRRFKALFEKGKDSSPLGPNSGPPPEVPRYLHWSFYFLEMLCYPLQAARTPAQRALLVGTLFFGMIINGLYQSILVSSLSKPFHYPQLQTLEDVLNSSKMLITKYANLKSVFVDESAIGARMSQRIHVVNSTKTTKDIVAYEDKIAISRYYSMVLGDFAYYDKDGNPLLYVVDECPMNYRVSYVLTRYSPYGERVDFILLRLKEAGLVTFWFDTTLNPVKILRLKRKAEADKRTIQLTLDHYSLTFVLLFAGLFAATLMFLAEVYVASVAKEKRKKT